jgi:hypothetical protein
MEALEYLQHHGVITDSTGRGLDRSNTYLIEIIEKLGKAASARGENIKVIEIPNDVIDWYIAEYDGQEWVAEGRTWFATENE